jgi:hypothetical protein
MSTVTKKIMNRLPGRACHLGIGGALLVTGALVDQPAIAAPTVLANPGPTQPLQTEDQQNQPNEMQVFQPAEQPQGLQLPEIFQYGQLKLHPHADYVVTYGTGIQSAPGQPQSTVIQEFSPGFTLDLGPHWALAYTPTFRFYSSREFNDGVDHSIGLTGAVDYDAWRFGFGHTTQITSDPTVETGTQTDQTSHATTLSASRALSSQMSADFSLNQTITLVTGYADSYDWNTLDWLNYQFWPRFNVGVGAGGGYVLVEEDGGSGATAFGNSGSGHQTYEQLQGRVNWRATDKISFQLNAGLEDRQFSTPNTSDSLNPIFGAAIQYQAFKYTQVSLNASRTVSSSDFYLAAQQTEVTSVGVDVNQRLFRKFNVDAGVSYSITDFSTASGAAFGSAANRTDDVVAFNVRLTHPLYRRGTWSVFYQYSQDSSSQPGFGFQSNQVGFEITYAF